MPNSLPELANRMPLEWRELFRLRPGWHSKKGTISMKLYPTIHLRRAMAVACGIALATVTVSFRAKADQWDKRTILTVSQPIQVTDTVLQPGQYVFKLYNSSSERHIVQIFNADQSHIISTVMAIPKERMEPTGKSTFTFWETPPGTAKAMRSWFYPGDTIGQEFPYPQHPYQVDMLESSVTTAPAAPAPEPAVTQPSSQEETTAEEAPPPEPAKTEEQPTEIAQAAPPPAPVEPPAATPEPPPVTSQPTELPKTGSPYPLIGLCGTFLLGLSVLLRLKRSA